MSASDPQSPYPGILVPPPGRSLLARLMRLFVLALLIPAVVIPILALGYLYKQSLIGEIEDGLSRARQQTKYVENFLDAQAMNALVVSQFPETRTLANSDTMGDRQAAKSNLLYRMTSYLRSHRELFSGFHYVDIKGRQILGLGFDKNGEVIPFADEQMNFSNEPWFRGANHLAAIQGKRTPVFFTHEGAGDPIRFSTVVLNDEGILNGVLVLEMDLERLLVNLPPMKEGFFCTLLDENGDILYPRSPENHCTSVTPDIISQALSKPSGTIPPDSQFPQSLHQFSRVQPKGQSAIRWTFLYDTPLSGIAGSFQNALFWILIGTLISVVLSLILLWSVSRQITSPILQLSTAAQDISHGHWDTELPSPNIHDETYSLTVAFASMCRQLKSAQESLLRHIERLTDSEKDLSLEKDRIAATLAAIGDAVVALDREGRIQLLNPVAERMLAVTEEEALEQPFTSIAHLQTEFGEEEELFALLHEETPNLLTTLHLTNSIGGTFLLEYSASPVRGQDQTLKGWVLVMRDVRETRKQAEEKNRLERLESLGLLAGGIGHDFNNLLAVILGDLSLLHLQLKQETEKVEILEHAGEAAHKAKELTRQLMTFVKGGPPIKTRTSLSDLAEESARFVLHGTKCKCHVDAEQHLKPIQVDPGQLHQVFHNLTLNAVQAMPEGGEIRVTLRNLMLRDSNPVALPPGPYIQVRVTDQGHGIPSEMLNRIFDPYFTTKDTGTGLGLCSVHNILTAHGGHISVQSTPSGTTFTFLLPALEADERPSAPPPPKQEGGSKQSYRVLVMDDDANIRTTTRRILEHFGHKVEEACDGEEAKSLVRAAYDNSAPYDVLILDLTIPGGKGGRQVYEELSTHYPDLAAIVTSGYSLDDTMARYREIGFKGRIQKPYSLTELMQVLHEAVAQG